MFQFNSSFLLHVSNIVYVHHQEDYIVHAALYGMFFMLLCKQSSRLKDVLGLEHILQPAFCCLTLHNCITMHGTKNI